MVTIDLLRREAEEVFFPLLESLPSGIHRIVRYPVVNKKERIEVKTDLGTSVIRVFYDPEHVTLQIYGGGSIILSSLIDRYLK